MKGLTKLAAITALGAFLGNGVPVIAGQNPYSHPYEHGYAGRNAYAVRDSRSRHYEPNCQERDRGNYSQGAAYGYSYAPSPVYEEAPGYQHSYRGPAYDPYYGRTHHGRDAAIVLGGAAAGALIGGAAGNGRGAAIGALVGGIAGAVTSSAADHHDRDHRR